METNLRLINIDPYFMIKEKVTAGITAQDCFRDLIEGSNCDLDVGLGLLFGAEA